MNDIKTTYRGVEVVYDEWANKWRFEIYGKERSAESLRNAKDAIDAPPPKDNKKYKPTRAILRNYQGCQEVTVTSAVADIGYYWVKDDKGNRTKESNLFVFGPANVSIVDQVKGLKQESTEIDRQIAELHKQMTPFRGLEEAE